MEDKIREVLKELTAEYGIGILEDTDRLAQFLEDRRTGSRPEIFRLTFALRYLIKAGWNPRTVISERGAALYVSGLIRDLGFTDREARDVIAILRAAADSASPAEDKQPDEGIVASAGNLRRIAGGVASKPRTMWIRKKSMRNGLVLIAALIGIAVLFFQIGNQRNPVGDELRIAFFARLSGSNSQSGLNQLRAVQLAVENVNKQGGVHGYKLKIVGFDLPSGPEEAKKTFANAMKDPSILVAVSGIGGAAGQAVCPVADAVSVPLVIAAVDARVTDNSGRPFLYAFSIANNVEDRVKMMAYFVAQGLGKKRNAVFYELNESFSSAHHDALVRGVRNMGGEVVADISFARRSAADYTPAAKAINQSGAEVLMLPNAGSNTAPIVTAARAAGFTLPIIGFNYTENLSDAAGKAMAGSWWINEVSSLDPQIRSVLSDFRVFYNENVPHEDVTGVMLAYDAVVWIAHAFYSASGYRGEAIRHALLSTRNLPTTHATLTIDPRTHAPYKKAMSVVYCDSEKGIFQKRVRITDTD